METRTTPRESYAKAGDDSRNHTPFEKYESLKPHVFDFEDREPVLSLTSIPYMSNLRFHKFGTCLCDPEKHFHMDFLDFNSRGILYFRDTLNSKIQVCFNNYNLFDKALPKQSGFKSWWTLKTADNLNELLFRTTHWYRSFWDGNKPEKIITKLMAFLTGMDVVKVSLTQMWHAELLKERMQSLKNIIASCDGILTTLFLFWEGQKVERIPTWTYLLRIQRFIFKGLFDDYLKDLTDDVPTFYTKVKDMKNYVFGNVSKERMISRTESPWPEIFFFDEIISFFREKLIYRTQIVKLRIISDTRTIGLPPPVMREKAYEDFWKECITPSKRPTPEHIALVEVAMKEILSDIEAKDNLWAIFERSFQNEKISLSGSADLESTANEGGKIESANHYLREVIEKKVRLINLETGELGEPITKEDMLTGKYTPGQALLSLAVQVYDAQLSAIMDGTFDDEVTFFDFRAVAVSDQSKYRIATTGHFLYNVLLQPVAQVLKALFKCFESTRSGMEKQYHMWEFFKRIPRKMLQYVRLPSKPQEVENFFYCEDWKKATDKFNKFQIRIMIRDLMKWIGIPSHYRNIVERVFTMPKRVKIPDLVRDVPNEFFSLSGVFQGDPITKNMLQISHIVSRKIAIFVLKEVSAQSSYQRGMQISGIKKYDSWEEKKVYVKTHGGIPFNLKVFNSSDKVQLLKELMFEKNEGDPRKGILSEIGRRIPKLESTTNKVAS